MKSLEKNTQKIDQAFDDFFDNFENDFENDAKVIASGILNEIKEITDKRELNRKDIAGLLGTSASFLTQLYRGNKLLNLVTLAKLKKKLDLNIEINITENQYNHLSDTFDYNNLIYNVPVKGQNINWLILKNLNTSNLSENEIDKNKASMEVIKKQLTA